MRLSVVFFVLIFATAGLAQAPLTAQKPLGKNQILALAKAGMDNEGLVMGVQEHGIGPTPGQVRKNPKDGLKYVWIPPGTFMMGCSPRDSECQNDEKPSHGVTISTGFWLGQTEVTVGAYKRFAREAGRGMPPEPTSEKRALNPGWGNEQMPMVNVNWDDAQAYCAWAGGRLPTEAEWEYAARAGSTTARYGPLDEIAWYLDNSGHEPLGTIRKKRLFVKRLKENGNGMHEVGQKRANGFGLFDMLGNVWEWVNDWYDEHYYPNSPGSEPQGPSGGQARVARGGCWGSGPWTIRISRRSGVGAGNRSIVSGFRCVGEVAGP